MHISRSGGFSTQSQIKLLPRKKPSTTGHMFLWRALCRQLTCRCVQEREIGVQRYEGVSLDIDDVLAYLTDRRIEVERVDQGDSCIVTQTHPVAVPIKCIIMLQDGLHSVLVILRDEDKISIGKLARRLGVSKSSLELAPRSELVRICGFVEGRVPPFGHPVPLATVVVDATLAASQKICFGYKGEYIVTVASMLECCQPGTIVEDVRQDERGTHGGEKELPKPWKAGETRVELIGRVVKRRKLAKTLVFATIAPVQSAQSAFCIPRASRKTLVWQNPVSGCPCEVQLILGKTIERKYGRERLAQVLKQVKSGVYVHVSGTVQQNPKESKGREQVMDLVVGEIEFLPASAMRMNTQDAFAHFSKQDDIKSLKRSSPPSYSNFGKNRKKKITGLENFPLYTNTTSEVVLVQSLQDIAAMQGYFDACCGPVRTLESFNSVSGDPGRLMVRLAKEMYTEGWEPACVVGLDAEWRPTSEASRKSPVSLFQIASKDRIFLIDMLDICYTDHQGCELTTRQEKLSNFISYLFGNHAIVKVGFGLRYDLKRISESYPWLPCFTSSPSPILSHVDALILARHSSFADSHTSFKRIGLSKLSAKILGMALNKEEQLSDWGARPLSDSQKEYAAADVACLVDIYNKIVSTTPGILSPRTMLACAANLFSLQLADSHVMSSLLADTNSDLHGHKAKQRSRPIDTRSIQCDSKYLQFYLGKPLPHGGGKLEAIKAGVAMPIHDTAVQYRIPRGAAIIELSNSFYLFINTQSRVYPNTFVMDKSTGRCAVSWWTSAGQTHQHPMIQRLLGGEKDIHLFCRPPKKPYVYMGTLSSSQDDIEESENGMLKIMWTLDQYSSDMASLSAVQEVFADSSVHLV